TARRRTPLRPEPPVRRRRSRGRRPPPRRVSPGSPLERQEDRHLGTESGLARDRDPAAVGFEDLAGQREAESLPGTARPDRARAAERVVERPRPLLRRPAQARV